MNKDIEVTTSQKDDIAIINIKGDVTADTGGAIEDAYKNAPVSESKKILLYFDKDSYINSGGIAFLIGIASEARKKEQKICATGLSEHFEKIFHMVGLTRCVELFKSEDEAVSNFNS